MNTSTLIQQDNSITPCLSKAAINNEVDESVIAYSDDELLKGIKNRNNAVLEYIYEEWYPMIYNLVMNHSGSSDDARDIFQDAMVVIYNKVKKNDLVLYSALKTYFYSICKHLSLKNIERKRRTFYNDNDFSDAADDSPTQSEAAYENEIEKYSIFKQHFLNLTDEARQLLNLYLEKHSLKEICQIMGYKSEGYAKSRKYLVKEELKHKILSDPYYQRLCNVCA